MKKLSSEIQSVIKIVEKFLGVTVIYGYQDFERPKKEYICIYLIDEKQIGYATSEINEDGKISTLKKEFSLLVCFDCIGENPYEFANKLSMMFELESIRSQLKKSGLSWYKSHQIRNTTTILDSCHQERVSFEAAFYFNRELKEDINIIEKVNINGIN